MFAFAYANVINELSLAILLHAALTDIETLRCNIYVVISAITIKNVYYVALLISWVGLGSLIISLSGWLF